MGMPVTVEILDQKAKAEDLEAVFAYFDYIDETFSPYKPQSEISRLNQGGLGPEDLSADMKEVLGLCEQTRRDTGGYFNILTPKGAYDPSGLVKGWAVWKAAGILKDRGLENFFIEAGGDVQASRPANLKGWSLGIRNPFEKNQIVKVLSVFGQGVATSGSYLRGQHIYNPYHPKKTLDEVVSLTVVGPNVYEADRFATAAFAMGEEGLKLILSRPELEAYQIDKNGRATMTPGFEKYIL